MVAGSVVTFPFLTMAPLRDLYLASHQLMVHDSYMPRGQRHALAKLSLTGGYGTTVEGSSPSVAKALVTLGKLILSNDQHP